MDTTRSVGVAIFVEWIPWCRQSLQFIPLQTKIILTSIIPVYIACAVAGSCQVPFQA